MTTRRMARRRTTRRRSSRETGELCGVCQRVSAIHTTIDLSFWCGSCLPPRVPLAMARGVAGALAALMLLALTAGGDAFFSGGTGAKERATRLGIGERGLKSSLRHHGGR